MLRMDLRITILSLLFLFGYPIRIDAQEAEPTTEMPLVDTTSSSVPVVAADVTDHPHPGEQQQPVEQPAEAAVSEQPPEQPEPVAPHILHRTQPTHLPPGPDTNSNEVSPEDGDHYPTGPAPYMKDELPTKTSIQATFKFSTEERCFHFLKRLKSKGKNENSDHPLYGPLSCSHVFDGILCWRPADPGETLLQVCPDGPTNTRTYAKRECVNGQWRDYGNANADLKHHGITTTDYADCLQVPSFVRKHGLVMRRPFPNGTPTQPGSHDGVDEYGFSTPAIVPTQYYQDPSYTPGPEDVYTTTATYDSQNTNAPYVPQQPIDPQNPPPQPWLYKDIEDCRHFLHSIGQAVNEQERYCPGNKDDRFCWPATAPGAEARQPCYQAQPGQDPSQLPQATRYCGTDGRWNETKPDGSIAENADPSLHIGYTNYEACDQNPAPETTAPIHAGGVVLQGIALSHEDTTTAGSQDIGPTVIIPPSEGTTIAPQPEVNGTTEVTSAAATQGPSMALTGSAAVTGYERAIWNPTATFDSCKQLLKELNLLEAKDGGCKAELDGKICWPATAKNTVASLYCPQITGLDPTKKMTRKCDANGAWTKASYPDCLPSDLKDFVHQGYHALHASSAPGKLVRMLPLVFLNFLLFVLL